MRFKVILLAFSCLFLSKTVFSHPVLSNPFDSIYSAISVEFDKVESTDYAKIAESLNLLTEDEVLLILKNKGVLAGEHTYDAEKLWQLHLAASCLGTHSNIALCLRRTNKFQASLEAKEGIRNQILSHLSIHKYNLPKWLNFNDLTVIENKKIGVSNAEINDYFRAVRTRYTDDEAWCAAYVGAKLKVYNYDFKLPQNAYRAASFGGFGDSGFSFNTISKNSKKEIGRYSSLADLTYLPKGQVSRYNYTIDDFKGKNKIPFGALVIFKRQGGGHIGFVVGTVKDSFDIIENGNPKMVMREGIVILGGNQNDAVQFEVFYDLDKIRAVTIPTNFPKEDYSEIPEIKDFYDLPEFYEKVK
jgi:hypothetical protein